MIWKVKISATAEKAFAKLDFSIKKRIDKYLNELIKLNNPAIKGKLLSSNLAGLYRYRIGSYRLIVQINNKELIILILSIGHRKDIYKS